METPVKMRKAWKVSGIDVGIAICLILIAISLRLIPHPPNFAPIAAVAIFGGALLPRRFAIAVPLAAIVATDFIIGFHDLILVTWGSYALIALGSNILLSKRHSFLRGVSVTLASSIFFFVTTNFAVWLTSGMYARTWNGLIECFTLALPFFRNTLASDLFYVSAMFGLYSFAVWSGIKLAGFRQETA